MTRLVTSIRINRPIETVFDYVTTPASWPQWHPSSIRVDTPANKSLNIGEQVREDIKVGWQRDRVLWTVLERERPRRWTIEGQGEHGGRATIRYELTSDGAGTRFRRDLAYQMPNAILALVDLLIVRRIMNTTSRNALERLKQALEQQQAG